MLKTTQALKTRTGTPDKYPQGRFSQKPCRQCSTVFQPNTPAQLYCGTVCAQFSQRDKYYLRTYGIGVRQWQEMYDAQGGRCYVCRSEGFVMRDCHEAQLMVDHCHTTGLVRGLLCHNCNRALGLLQDNTDNLSRALEYLERATTISSESSPKRGEARGPSV